MQNGDEALPSVSLVGPSQLAKLHITIEPYGLF